ncbi:MAG: hypothetical protein ACTSXQ_06220 [Alphaproteobacteria bacterium]
MPKITVTRCNDRVMLDLLQGAETLTSCFCVTQTCNGSFLRVCGAFVTRVTLWERFV